MVSGMVPADTLAGPARFVVTCFVFVNFSPGRSETLLRAAPNLKYSVGSEVAVRARFEGSARFEASNGPALTTRHPAESLFGGKTKGGPTWNAPM